MSKATPASRPYELTWAVLLSKWVEFAQSAVALPSEGAEGLLKQSVADIIGLQAVWFALQEVDDLSPEERALGLDRAAVLIQKHRDALVKRWAGQAMPEGIQSLIVDTESRWRSWRA